MAAHAAYLIFVQNTSLVIIPAWMKRDYSVSVLFPGSVVGRGEVRSLHLAELDKPLHILFVLFEMLRCSMRKARIHRDQIRGPGMQKWKDSGNEFWRQVIAPKVPIHSWTINNSHQQTASNLYLLSFSSSMKGQMTVEVISSQCDWVIMTHAQRWEQRKGAVPPNALWVE